MRDLRWRVYLDPRLRHSRAGRIDGIKLLSTRQLKKIQIFGFLVKSTCAFDCFFAPLNITLPFSRTSRFTVARF